MIKDSPSSSLPLQSISEADASGSPARARAHLRRSTAVRSRNQPRRPPTAPKESENAEADLPSSHFGQLEANLHGEPPTARNSTLGDVEAASQACHYLKMRRKRLEIIGADIFADPCWDMLLDLFAQTASGTDVSVKSACLASGVPFSTALGHLGILEREGLVTRAADKNDRRRTFLRLSDEATLNIRRWLAATFA